MNRVPEYFHTLNSRDSFIHVKINMLLEEKFSIKNVLQVSPYIPRLKSWISN